MNPQVRNISAITLGNEEYLGEDPLAEEEKIHKKKRLSTVQNSDPRSRHTNRGRGQEVENVQNTEPRSRQTDRGRGFDLQESEKLETTHRGRGQPTAVAAEPSDVIPRSRPTNRGRGLSSEPIVSSETKEEDEDECKNPGMITIPTIPPDKEIFVIDSSVEHDYSEIVDLSDLFDESVCWTDAVIPPDKENFVVDSSVVHDCFDVGGLITTVIPPDKENHIIDVADKVVDPSDRPPTTVLGSCPTLLTPQNKILVSTVVQVVEKKRKRPPEKPKYGGDQKKKMGRATEVHGLRFKPFHDWFRQIIFDAEVPQGPKGYG